MCRRRRQAQKVVERAQKGANGTDVNSTYAITLGAKEALEGGHQGHNSKIAGREKNIVYIRALTRSIQNRWPISKST